MSTTVFESCITEGDHLLQPICNKITAKYNINSGCILYFRCHFVVEFDFLPPNSDNDNRYEWDRPLTDMAYVADNIFSSYQSAKLHMSDFFATIAMPEEDQVHTIESVLAFFNIQRRICKGVIPMLLDLRIVTVIRDVEEVDEFKTVPAAEWSIQALEKSRVIDDGEYCTVCLEELSLGTEVLRMPCLHLFHGDCIAGWLRTTHMCPVCRFAVPCD